VSGHNNTFNKGKIVKNVDADNLPKRSPKKAKESKRQFDSQELINKEVVSSVFLKEWPNEYIPVKPTPFQLAFCFLPMRSILYGGAAGGGKSEALLMAALQYVKVPGYSAVIFRKSYADLARSGALMDRALEWMAPHLGKTVTFDYTTKTLRFVTGGVPSKVSFGYMGVKGAEEAIQGAEYHFVGIDEVTQHHEQDVAWAETRLRRTEGAGIPIRLRLTANPGGRGHSWVKKRFGIRKNPKWSVTQGKTVGNHFFSDQPMFTGTNPDELFLPARLTDNPYLDAVEYLRSFKNLDDVTRAQLLDGDWDSSPASRFRPQWFNRYSKSGEYYRYGATEITLGGLMRFATVDVAASVREGVSGEQFYTAGGSRQSAMPCWTVVSVWATDGYYLWLLEVERGQVESPDVFTMIEKAAKKWRCADIYVEANGVGRPVASVARSMGLPVSEIWTFRDKIQNSYVASNMAKAGKVLLPEAGEDRPWLQDFEDEVFTWTGHPEETSDQVDTLSMAAKVVQGQLMPQVDEEGTFDRHQPHIMPSLDFWSQR
jgi:hypothetical protein